MFFYFRICSCKLRGGGLPLLWLRFTALHCQLPPTPRTPTLLYSYSESLSMQTAEESYPNTPFSHSHYQDYFSVQICFQDYKYFYRDIFSIFHCMCDVYHIFITVYKTARLHFPVTVYSTAPPFTANGQLHLQVPTGHRRVVHGLNNAPRY